MKLRARELFHTVVTKASALAQRCKTKSKTNTLPKTAAGNEPGSSPTNATDEAPSGRFQSLNLDGRTQSHNKSPSGKTKNKNIERLEARKDTDLKQGTKPQLTDAPCSFVVATDGENDCLALLIDKQMLSTLREVASGRVTLERKERVYEDTRIDALFARSSKERSDKWIQVGDLQEEAIRPQEENEEGLRRADQAKMKEEMLENELGFLRHQVNQMRDQFQDFFEKALRNANLLETPESMASDVINPAEKAVSTTENEEEPSESKVPQLLLCQSNNTSIETNQVNSVAHDTNSAFSISFSIASSHAQFDEADESLNLSWLTLQVAREDFDNRHDEYLQQLDEWKKFTAEDQGIISRTEFDVWAFKRGQTLTRRLMDAEERYRYAKAHARSFGIIADPRDQSSDFSDREDDGYRESEEAECIEAVDRDYIKAWSHGVSTFPDIGEDDDSGSVDVNEWTARPVGISDSASLRDVDEYRGKIDRWRSSCEQHREIWQPNPYKQLSWGVRFIVSSDGDITVVS